MSDKFQNKYRIPSARLQNWDYGSNAAYFITICNKNRECFFGEILDNEMILSDIGQIIENEWMKTPEIRPDMNLQLGEFVIMPNHFHAIIFIGENEYNTQRDAQRRDAMHRVSTTTTITTENINNPNNNQIGIESKNKFGSQSKNLASIIRGFKSSVTINARKIHADFAWQSRFHDHIIRDVKSFQCISEYIRNNPLNWTGDIFFNTHSTRCRDAMHRVLIKPKQNNNKC